MVDKIGGWNAYLKKVKGWVDGQTTFFIFDESQLSYEDFDLWSDFFKNAPSYSDRFIISFASYGSPTSQIGSTVLGSSRSDPDADIRSTPFAVSNVQRVTLRPIHHHDGLGAVGLLFTRTEFNDLIAKRFPQSDYHFDLSLLNSVFDLTGGHVGAIIDLMSIVIAHDVPFFIMSGHIT